MPRLVILAPCVDYILGQDGSLSLIKIVDQLSVDAAAVDGDSTAQFSAPLHVVTSWARESADGDARFEQRLRVVDPTGAVAVEKRVRFVFAPEATGHYTLARLDGFPVGSSGTYSIQVALRRADDTDDPDEGWMECNAHPFRVRHM